jgi:hypothetical protein
MKVSNLDAHVQIFKVAIIPNGETKVEEITKTLCLIGVINVGLPKLQIC